MNFGGLSFRRSPLTPPSCAHLQSLPREINVELARKRFLFYLWLMVCRHLQRPAWPGTARKIMLRCPPPTPHALSAVVDVGSRRLLVMQAPATPSSSTKF